MLKVGERCSRCTQIIPKRVVDEKRRARAENARRSAAKARSNGTHYGRRKIRNDDQIKALRRQGLTMREIAKEIGLSTSAVQRGLKAVIPLGLEGEKK
jgi:AraC-like DNA-binding protein